jgi:hypothetical protein
VSKGSRQNRSVPLVKRLALRIGQFGIVLEIVFSCDGMERLRLRIVEVPESCGLVNVRTLARILDESKKLYGL